MGVVNQEIIQIYDVLFYYKKPLRMCGQLWSSGLTVFHKKRQRIESQIRRWLWWYTATPHSVARSVITTNLARLHVVLCQSKFHCQGCCLHPSPLPVQWALAVIEARSFYLDHVSSCHKGIR